MKQFLTWLDRALERLDDLKAAMSREPWPTPAQDAYEAAGDIAEQLGNQATRLGLSELVTEAAALEGASDVNAVRALVSKAMAICRNRLASGDGPFDVSQVARMLNLCEKTIYELVDCGKLTCGRHGKGRGALRFSRQDLEAYLELARDTPALQTTDAKRKRLLKLS